MIPEGSELLGNCESVVALALARGADEAEVVWQSGASVDVEIEAGKLAGAGRSLRQGAGIRVVLGGRLGFAYMTRIEDAAATIDRALAAARIGPGKNYTLPEGGRVDPLPGRWNDSVAELDVANAVTVCNDLIAGAKAACPDASLSGGGVGVGWSVEAIASSAGVAAWDRTTSIGAGASLVLEDGETAVNGWQSESSHHDDLDGGAIGQEVGQTVKSLTNPAASDAGTKDVIFLPDAGAELIQGFISGAVDGDEAKRGRSVWSDSLDKGVTHAGLSIVDDARHVGGIGTSAMDGEGLATSSTTLIGGGQLKMFMFDSWTGHQHGVPSSHHAVRGDFKALPGVGSHHWVTSHQNTLAMDKLIGDVDDGYLVESALGAHTANSTTGDFSITSPNVWRIKKGELAGASGGIAIGGNLPDMLQRLDGVSDNPRRRDGSIVPAMRFRDVTISV